MPPTPKAHGAQAATLDTVHELLNTTDSGTYVLSLDLNVLAAGDIVVLRVERKVRSAGTSRKAFETSFGPVPPDEKAVQSIPVVAPHGARFTLEQTDGTARTWEWEVDAL